MYLISPSFSFSIWKKRKMVILASSGGYEEYVNVSKLLSPGPSPENMQCRQGEEQERAGGGGGRRRQRRGRKKTFKIALRPKLSLPSVITIISKTTKILTDLISEYIKFFTREPSLHFTQTFSSKGQMKTLSWTRQHSWGPPF